MWQISWLKGDREFNTLSSHCTFAIKPSQRGTEHMVPQDLTVFLKLLLIKSVSAASDSLHYIAVIPKTICLISKYFHKAANPNNQMSQFSDSAPASLLSSSPSLSKCSSSPELVALNGHQGLLGAYWLCAKAQSTDLLEGALEPILCKMCFLNIDRNVQWLPRGEAWLFWHSNGAFVFEKELGKFWSRAVRDGGWLGAVHT